MLKVEVDGVVYDGFTEVSMVDDYEQLCNQFVLKCTASNSDFFPIYRDASINIYNGDTRLMTGIVEIINGSYSANDYTVKVSGRDITRNVLKNDIPPGLSFAGPTTLESVIKKTLTKIGVDLAVINLVEDEESFSDKEILKTDIGDSVWDFWVKLAQKVQVLITKDENGNIVLINPKSEKYNTTLVNFIEDPNEQNNILTAKWKYDDSERRYIYNVYSHENVSIRRRTNPPLETEYWTPEDVEFTDASVFLDTGKTSDRYKALYNRFQFLTPGTNEYIAVKRELAQAARGEEPNFAYTRRRQQTSGVAIDTNGQPGSACHMVSDDPADNDECLRQAKWKANQQRIRSVQYSCEVENLTIDNQPWKSGYLIDVFDEVAQIKAEMLITRVEYNSSVTENGSSESTVSLTFSLPDAYTKNEKASDVQKGVNVVGNKWNNGDFQ